MNDPRYTREGEEWLWWKHGVIYQIYPRSFYDTDDNGVGDIPGIIEKLPYIESLGVSAIWLSPINRSPMYDFGYDISDYRSIDPLFGTNEDFDRLIKEAHGRNIRIIMDMVMNHTSHEHPWFQESRASRDSEKRNWYIWRKGRRSVFRKRPKPPSNWLAAFGGSSWQWDERTEEFYMHSFLPEQPDVNWRNEELKEAMFGEIRYWLDRGVDGFRLDVVNWFIKDDRFRNNPFNLGFFNLQYHTYDRNRPETHDLLKEIRRLLDSYDERMSVGEVFTLPPGNPRLSASFTGKEKLHMAFDFSPMYRWWNSRMIYTCTSRWMKSQPEGGWPCHVFSNHDQPRSICRYGSGKTAFQRARVLATYLLTLKGTPFVYYGEEIGMNNFRLKKSDLVDPLGKRLWPLFQGRDPARTPMQWAPVVNAGFTKGKVWLPVSPDYQSTNVEVEEDDPYSLLNYYRGLIALRNRKPALNRGEWKAIRKGHHGVISWFRYFQGQVIAVAMNFEGKGKKLRMTGKGHWRVLHSTHRPEHSHFLGLRFSLEPYEATVLERLSG